MAAPVDYLIPSPKYIKILIFVLQLLLRGYLFLEEKWKGRGVLFSKYCLLKVSMQLNLTTHLSLTVFLA